METLNRIYESVRKELINLEAIEREIKMLKVNNQAERELKKRMNEYLSTTIGDLLSLYEFIFEAESCLDENDLQFFLDISKEEIETIEWLKSILILIYI